MLFTLSFSLFLACPDPTYDVPTTYTLPTENPSDHNPHNGSPQDGVPQDGNPPDGNPPPDGEIDPNGDYKHEHVPHREMPPNSTDDDGLIPPGDDVPPPPKEDVESSGDEPPPSDDSIIQTPGEPQDNPNPPQDDPIDPSPGAISFEDGCIISHQWKKLRSEDIEKVQLETSLDIATPVQTLLVDIISPKTREVKVGLICPSKDISVSIPKNLGEVQLAIFVDNNNNGPSADDKQALSDLFDVGEKTVSIKKIPLSDTPISFYNFKE